MKELQVRSYSLQISIRHFQQQREFNILWADLVRLRIGQGVVNVARNVEWKLVSWIRCNQVGFQ
jgi:hypothetical protein